MSSNRLKIFSGAFGAQYALATRFFDQRGALIEGALNVFKQPHNVEVQLPNPGDIVLRSAHPENIQLTISPVKTVLQLEPFTSLDEFRALIEKFCNTMNKFYAVNRFEFVGVVLKVQERSNIMSLMESFPIFSRVFASSVGPITNSRITYTQNDYRVHITLSLNLAAKIYTLEFDTQKIGSIDFQQAPTLMEECYKRLQYFLDNVKAPERR